MICTNAMPRIMLLASHPKVTSGNPTVPSVSTMDVGGYPTFAVTGGRYGLQPVHKHGGIMWPSGPEVCSSDLAHAGDKSPAYRETEVFSRPLIPIAKARQRRLPPSNDPNTPRTICRPTVLPSVRAALLAIVSARLSPRRPPDEPDPNRSLYQVVAFGAGC
jgi:hypothetical protein